MRPSDRQSWCTGADLNRNFDEHWSGTITCINILTLKALDMFGNYKYCQRPVFSLGVSHTITNRCQFGLNRSLSLEEYNKRKNTTVAQMCVLSAQVIKNYFGGIILLFEWEITSCSKTVTLEGAVSQNVLHYQQLSDARYRVSFYAIL